jgi:hypothetical protein
MRANGDSSSAVLEICHKVYERSLVLYPRDLYRVFGDEMLEVFDEQVSDAYSQSGFRGLLRVCFGATRELVTIALPGRLAQRMLPVFAVSATLAFMVWFAGYVGYVMETACGSCGR